MKILSRAEAKQAALSRYFTGEPCKYGHVAERYVTGGRCCVCVTNAARVWRHANPDGVRAMEARRAAKLGSATERVRAWRKANPARTRAQTAMSQSKRRAVFLQRTPAWADLEAIAVVYRDAEEFRSAGFPVDVDHIIPLQGERVSGLHVPENLRVCLSSVNRSKSNTYQIL